MRPLPPWLESTSSFTTSTEEKKRREGSDNGEAKWANQDVCCRQRSTAFKLSRSPIFTYGVISICCRNPRKHMCPTPDPIRSIFCRPCLVLPFFYLRCRPRRARGTCGISYSVILISLKQSVQNSAVNRFFSKPE